MGGIAGGGISLGTLSVEIQAKLDQATKAFNKFNDEVSDLIDEQKKKWKSLDDIGDQLSRIGGGLTAAITAPLAGLSAVSIKLAGDFEASLNKISAVGDIVGADLEFLREAALKFGADTQFSAQQAADGMAELAAKGFDTKQILSAMPGILALAAAGQLSIADASRIASATMKQFGMDANDTQRIADVLAAAANQSATDVAELGQALNYVGPVAKGAGIAFEETAAAIAVLSDGGRGATQAGTDLRGVIASLVAPSKKAAEELTALGVNALDSTGKMRPLNDIFLELQKSGANTEQMFKIFGREGATAAIILRDQAGPALAKVTQGMYEAEGAAQKAADTLNKGFRFQLEQFKGSLETVGIALGTALLPAVNSVLKSLTAFLNETILPLVAKFKELPEPVQTAAIAFAALAAAAGPLLMIAGQMASSIASIGALLGTGAGGLAGLLTAATPLLVAFGAAFAAWVIYKAITDLVAINAELDRLYALIGQGIKATEDQAREIKVLEGALADHNKTLGAQKIVVDSTGKSINEYIEALRAAVPKSKDFKTGTEGITVTLGNLTLGTKAAAKEVKTHGDAVETTGEKHESAKKKVKAFNDEILLEKLRQAQAEHNKLVKEIAAYEIAAEKAAGKTFDLNAEWEKLTVSTNLGAAAIASVTAKLPPMYGAMEEANKVIERQDAAYKQLGITSTAELQRIAEAARVNYELILNSGTASARDLNAAWVAYEEARIKAARSVGEQVSQEELKTLERVKGTLETKLPEIENQWKGLANSVSTVITNFAQDISKSLWDGDMSWGEKGKSLLKSLGETVTSAFIEPATAAIGSFIKGALADLLGGKGFGGVWDSIKGIGSAVGGIFGGGGGGAGVGQLPGVGGAGGGAGAIGGAIGSGISGVVGAVGGIASAVSGIIGNFQMAGMNKTLDLIEKEVRYSQIHLSYILANTNDFFHRDWWKGYQNVADIRTAIVDSMEPQLARAAQHIDFFKQLAENDFKPALYSIAANTNAIMGATERIAVASERSVNMNLYGTDPEIVAARIAQQLRMQGGNG